MFPIVINEMNNVGNIQIKHFHTHSHVPFPHHIFLHEILFKKLEKTQKWNIYFFGPFLGR